jgi:hypothetical protein
MTARDIIQAAQAHGVTLALHGPERIRVMPPGVLPSALREAIREHREEILTLLEAFEERAAIAEYCGGLARPEAERLQTELPGILAWAVRGCLDWQRMGELGEPDAVVEATAGYRSEMDALGRFLEERCVLSPNVRVKAGALYDAYKQWCGETGEQATTLATMGKELDSRGFAKRPSMGIVWRLGIALPASGE